MVGLRGLTERTAFGASGEGSWSAGLEERALAYMTLGKISARYTDFLSLGYGDRGLDGGLGGDVALGVFPRFVDRHGPVVRLGFRGYFVRGSGLRSSLFEAPQVQLGYGWMTGTVHLEAAVRTGWALTGRYAVENADARRIRGVPELGGYVALGWRPLRIDVELSRIVPTDPVPGPLDSIRTLVCGAPGSPTICATFEAATSDLSDPTGRRAAGASATVGLSVGLGPAEWR